MPIDIERVKKAREAAGLNQREAAEKAEMTSPQAWQRIESGNHVNVSIATLDKMAAALGVKSKDLLK